MNIVKQSTGNVVLTDNSGNILKVFVQVNALDVVSNNEVVVKFGFNQWHSLFANQIDNTQIEPAGAVPFNGNAYDLVALLSSSFFFELSGGGSQDLFQVLTVGNSAGNLDIVDVDKLDFNTATTDTAGVGQLVWNDQDGTLDLGLKGGNVKLQIGQENIVRVVNKTTPLIDLLESNYQVVVVTGATGQRLSVKLAKADSDANSAGTLGLVTENIAKNQEGFITTVGLVRDINTTGSLQGETWNDGDILYLSPTVFGGITNVKPIAPQHLVIIGYVEYAHANHGKIYVKIDNGYELSELHDVAYPTTPVNNDFLIYNGVQSRWENQKATASIINYNNTSSGLTATNTQNAIDELQIYEYNTINNHSFLEINPIYSNQSTNIFVVNSLLCYGIYIKSKVTISNIQIAVTTGSIGNSVWGLYDSLNGLPNNKIFQSTEFNNGVTGLQIYTLPSPITINAGLYFVSYATTSIPTIRAMNADALPYVFGDTNTSYNGPKKLVARSFTYSSTLPSNWGVITAYYENNTFIPYVLFKII